MKTKLFSTFLLTGMICACFIAHAGIQARALQCEDQTNAQAIDIRNPKLSWKWSGDPSRKQKKVWIRIATQKNRLNNPDLWESPALETEEPWIRYSGPQALLSAQSYWWQVRIEDHEGKKSFWSRPARFVTGLFDSNDWKAKWIGAPWQGENEAAFENDHTPPPAPIFQKSFEVKGKIKEAYLFCSGLGYFEASVNGQKVSEDVLVPNQTNYGKRPDLIRARVPIEDAFMRYKVNYLGYDVKALLQSGSNRLQILLGNGFYNATQKWVMPYGSPRMIAQLHLEYADGRKDCIVSDTDWKVAAGPILWDGVYQGEAYDARIEPGPWQSAVLRRSPDGILCAQSGPADRVMERLAPIKIESIGPNAYRIDFGEEISGWVHLKNFKAPAGHRIDIRYLSESEQGTNYYICSGKGKETYAARFTWFVFRSVEVHHWPGKLKKNQITAEAVYSQVPTIGSFDCSNPLLNAIHRIWIRTQKDNMHGSIASDCPHRERSAYTGDGQVVMNTVMYNFETDRFYRKWIGDILDAQNPKTGYVPNGAPWQPGCGGGPGWGSAVCIMPWEYHMHYHAPELLQQAYPAMKAYFHYLERWKTPAGTVHVREQVNGALFKWLNLGDWSAPHALPDTELVHTFYAWLCADLISKTALEMGELKELPLYQNKALELQKAFVHKFYNPSLRSFGSHGENIFALYLGLPNHIRRAVIESVKQEIESRNGHLYTGIFGTRYLFEVLSENGMHQQAYEMLTKKTYPSFGYWIEQGATTTWERWDGKNSRNHPMFGGGLVWMYTHLCGLRPLKPGFKSIQFKPVIPEGLTHASFSTETKYGKTAISWKKEGDRIRMRVIVPHACTGQVYLPIKRMNIDELRAQTNQNVFLIGSLGDYAEFEVNAGEHEWVGY